MKEFDSKVLPMELMDAPEKPEDGKALMRFYEAEGSRLLTEAKGLAIVDQESRERTSSFVLRTREMIKKIKDWREPIIKKAFELHRSLTSERNQLTKPFEDAQRIADAEISRDFMEQKRLEREANERALREAKAAEEKERKRLEDLALKQLDRGDEAKAEATLARAEQVFKPAVFAPPAVKSTATGNGQTTVKLDFDVVVLNMKDLAAEVAAGRVPTKVLSLNLQETKGFIKGMKDGDKLPVIRGLQITERGRTTGRVA